jgi:hypothetical protein
MHDHAQEIAMRHEWVFGWLVIMLMWPNESFAADRSRIRTINIGSQGVVTLITGVVQGKVRTPRDVARCLLTGFVSGYGFYEAKNMIGRGNTQSGWIVANVAASLSENVAAGKNPLAQVGYSIGPFRLRVPLGKLDPSADSYVFVDVSAYEAVKLVDAIRDNDRLRFRSGLIAFERDSIYDREGDIITVGRAYGIYPGVWVDADSRVWPHEVIHAVQSLQLDAEEPSIPFLSYRPATRPGQPKRLIRFEHFKVGLMNLANDNILGNQRYENRWVEIEAYRLAQDQPPTPSP